MDKIIKTAQSDEAKGFKIHCFPEFPDGYSPDNGGKNSKDSGFQRIYFRQCDDSSGDSGGKNGGNEGNGEGIMEEVREVEEKAYVQGFIKGEKAGIESGAKKLEPIINSFRDVIVKLEKIKNDLYRNAEKEAVELSMAIAKKIVCHEIAINREVVLNVVKEALTRITDHDQMHIKVNPEDLNIIKQAKPEFSDFLDKMQGVIFEEDKTIRSGGCFIRTNMGDIDARIEKQFQALEEAFRTQLHQVE